MSCSLSRTRSGSRNHLTLQHCVCGESAIALAADTASCGKTPLPEGLARASSARCAPLTAEEVPDAVDFSRPGVTRVYRRLGISRSGEPSLDLRGDLTPVPAPARTPDAYLPRQTPGRTSVQPGCTEPSRRRPSQRRA